MSEARAEQQAQSLDGFNEHERLADLVHTFIAMMQAGGMARLDLEHGDLRLSLRAHTAAPAAMMAPLIATAAPATTVIPVATAEPQPPADVLHTISAPMIGTYYTAPAPNEPPFVAVGDRVEEGQTVGIIEAMKIMNEISADRAGVVAEIVAKNGQPVEYGSPLVRLQPDTA